ncbi:MAG: D-aminoacylase [Nitrospirota bacterium]|nr:D-aminoacylase [Nitrospirota bacterium]
MATILIKNGLIIDGTGRPGEPAAILIEGDRIISVGRIPTTGADTVIDASGMVVCPGFVDIHSHSEFSLLAHPQGDGKLLQGVTTEINGNCGLSAGPLLGAYRERRRGELADLGLELGWESLGEYFDTFDRRGAAVNIATYVGHGNLRGAVVGYENRPATPAEMDAMKALLSDAMEQGALGLATGLIYPPGVYSGIDELIELSRVVAKYGGIYSSHMRSEGDGLIEAITEAIEIGEKSGVGVQISHLKTSGQRNWHKITQALALIEEARGRGLDVTSDRYPYTAAATDLDAVLPSWAYEGGNDAELARLRDPETRKRLTDDILAQHPEPEYWQRVAVSSVETAANKGLEGLTMAQIAEKRKAKPWEALYDLLIEEQLKAGAIFYSMSEENLRTILRQPYVMVGSDSTNRGFSGITAHGKPHPRGFGSFPRVLGRFVREEGLLTLEEAIHKMTAQPARKLGMKDRGELRPGACADIVIFNPETVIDRADFDSPYQRSVGIRDVIVNGKVAVRDGEVTGTLAGKVLRKM